MMKSMTGFGLSTFEDDRCQISVEVKTLNSKSQDYSLRIPRLFSEKEHEIRQKLASVLDRGKVSFSIDFQSALTTKAKMHIDKDLFNHYYEELKSLAISVGAEQNRDFFRMALQMPEVCIQQTQEQQDTEPLWALLSEQIDLALTACDQFRIKEGQVLKGKFSSYLDTIASSLNHIARLDPIRVDKVRDRIVTKLKELDSEQALDQVRLEQEMIYYIEKLEITEEKVRLQNHIDHFREVMEQNDANGKKLGFISQEIGREINTIGSKANDAEIQRHVIVMKEELEKIKEQSLNIL